MNIINTNVVVRSNNSGVLVGKLSYVSEDYSVVCLENAARLWKWKSNRGVSLQGVSLHGIDINSSVVDGPVPWMIIRDVVDITPLSDAAMQSLKFLGESA